MDRSCAHCSTAFTATNARSLYCTRTCREYAKSLRLGGSCTSCGQAMHKSRTVARIPLCLTCRRARPGYKTSGAKPDEQWDCALCGTTCTRPATKGQRPRYCDSCKVRDWITPSRRHSLYERDQWTCWLCTERVDASLIGSRSPWRPSLDHVVPRSHGGSHNDENLRLAHQWCNCVRSDNKYEPEVFRAAV